MLTILIITAADTGAQPAECRVLNLTKIEILQSAAQDGGPFDYVFYVRDTAANGAVTYFLIEAPIWNMTDDHLRAKVESFRRRSSGTGALQLETVFAPANELDRVNAGEGSPRLAQFEEQHIKNCNGTRGRADGLVPSPGAPAAFR